MRVLWGDPQPFTHQNLQPYIEVIDQHIKQLIDSITDREGSNHMTITAESNTQTVTLDIEDGTIVRLVNDWCLTAQAGALAIVDRSLTNVDQGRYLPLTWLTGHASEQEVGGELRTYVQMDGGYNADTFEVFEFQVGDRVRVTDSPFEFGYEGVISSIPATNGDDCVVAVDFPHNASMSYLFDRLEKVAFPDPLIEMRNALMRAFGQATYVEVEPAYEVGDRVTVKYGHSSWDGPATVTNVTDRIIVVETDRGDTGGFERSEVEPLVEDCCASYYEDEDDEPLAEWEKELLGLVEPVRPRFNPGDIVVLNPSGTRAVEFAEWSGLRARVIKDGFLDGDLFVEPLDERPDDYSGAFNWPGEDFRAFDASDYRVGDLAESLRFGVNGEPAKAVVTRLSGEFGGDIEVNWTEGLETLVAYGPIGARREHLTLVGVEQGLTVEAGFEFEVGQEVAPEGVADLPDGTMLSVENGVALIRFVGESA